MALSSLDMGIGNPNLHEPGLAPTVLSRTECTPQIHPNAAGRIIMREAWNHPAPDAVRQEDTQEFPESRPVPSSYPCGFKNVSQAEFAGLYGEWQHFHLAYYPLGRSCQ